MPEPAGNVVVPVGLTSSSLNATWCATQRADTLAVVVFAPVAPAVALMMSSPARLARLAAVAFSDCASYRSFIPAAVVDIALPVVPFPTPCENAAITSELAATVIEVAEGPALLPVATAPFTSRTDVDLTP